MRDRLETTRGLWATIAAFATWGIVPVYWTAVAAVPPAEMIAWRVLWALPFLGSFLWWRRGLGQVWDALRRPRVLASLGLSAALVAFNWFVFIQAVDDGRIMQASLGYYINPLVNVLLGFLLLGERMRRLQWVAILLASAGVVVLVVRVGEVPVVALALAFSFGLYGFVRKVIRVEAIPGLFLEVLLLTPLASIWLGVRIGTVGLASTDTLTRCLVPVAGLITALPLGWFAYGARRLPLATVGILQFLAPTGQFLLATVVYAEPFSRWHLLTFLLIWASIALYLLDLRAARRRRAAPGRP